MPAVLVTPEAMRHPAAPYCQLLEQSGFEFRFPQHPQMARGGSPVEQVVEELQGFEAVIASSEPYSSQVLDQLPDLRVIARAGVGYDRVDVAAATQRNIAVTITPHANRHAVAELTLALMLAVCKRIVVNDRGVRQGLWERSPLVPLREKTLGILGLGRIGGCLAQKALALGMHVIAHDPVPNTKLAERLGVKLTDFDALLAGSDFLSLHCPLNAQTEGLFNQSVLQRMKPGSVLVNMARGQLVVESDLFELLQRGHLSAAALDVFQQEPPSPDNPLFQLDNVVVSPHMGGVDELSLVSMGMEAAQAIIDLHRGQWPDEAVVNRSLRDGWQW